MNIKSLSLLLDLIYPKVCLHCFRSLVSHENLICSLCYLNLPYAKIHLSSPNAMSKSLWGRVNISFAASFLSFRKEGITQKLLHELKYKGRKDIGLTLGYQFGQQLKEHPFLSQVNYLVPIPLHKKKLRARGYNQSELICKGLEKSLGIPMLKCVSKIDFTDTQTHKGRFARWLNVKHKFAVDNPLTLENKCLLIVDDVFTTGATMEACCSDLIKIEGIKLGIATLAIAEIN